MKSNSNLEQYNNEYQYTTIGGRYITQDSLHNFYKKCASKFKVKVIGKSVESRDIKTIEIGNGSCKVFAWSQMHGNESTTTKGLIDFINLLLSNKEYYNWFSSKYTFIAIPILNPDGAFNYTRVNANNIDLNRDALNQSQPESIVLRKLYDSFQPHFCLNLHDQRSIFGTENNFKSASFSLLAPAFNEACDYNKTRLAAVNVINHIVYGLQSFLPNQLGRFNDAFNENCVGDYFTKQGTPTILFEAGHYKNDYNREEVRKIVFISLKLAFNQFYENDIVATDLNKYLSIPQNLTCFYDFIFENINYIENNSNKIINFALQYDEVLENGLIIFKAKIVSFDIKDKFAHYYYNGSNLKDFIVKDNLVLNEYANFTLGSGIVFKEGIKIN